MTAKLSTTVIRMTIFIAPQSSSVVMKLSRDFDPSCSLNDIYVSQNEPFKLHCLCAISHILFAGIALSASPKDSAESVWTVRGRVNRRRFEGNTLRPPGPGGPRINGPSSGEASSHLQHFALYLRDGRRPDSRRHDNGPRNGVFLICLSRRQECGLEQTVEGD